MGIITINTNTIREVALMDGPLGVRLVNLSMDREGPTGYYTGAPIMGMPIGILISLFPSSEDFLYEHCGVQDYHHE